MPAAKIAPYGSWRSPITPEIIASRSISIGTMALDGEDLYWIETRPLEGGRNVIVRRTPDGQTKDVTPARYNARTRAHEYGGGDFTVADGTLFFANFSDQRLYMQAMDGEPSAITPAAHVRYADPIVDRTRQRLICVREDHREADREAMNSLVSLDLTPNSTPRILASGADFYSNPRLSPDGRTLAWLSWNHPNMPWDGGELWIAQIGSDGALESPVKIAGGVEESIFQPEWSPDGTLLFVSDRSGWWNILKYIHGKVEVTVTVEAEFGQPQWVFGMTTYAFQSAHRVVCAYNRQGLWHLASLALEEGRLDPIETEYTEIRQVRASGNFAYVVAGSPGEPLSVVRIDLKTGRTLALRRSVDLKIDPGYLSRPRSIWFPISGDQTAHAFFYPPQNRDYHAPEGERPPLLVKSHGGPTSAASTSLSLAIQFWTSRGIAVVDVNYGGSTGFGRAYRERLNDRWGIVDVDDCVNAAKYLVEKGEVDGNRLAISGGSAGGYTTLSALTFRDTFKVGASHYGIGDLGALARDTHKFESRYLDRLVGPYPARSDIYDQRSPLNFTDRLSCPVILFQGTDDKVVPPNQAERMVEALRAKGLPVAYILFQGEGHGFRRAENIKRVYAAELYFYSRIFGFPLAEPVESIAIDNLS